MQSVGNRIWFVDGPQVLRRLMGLPLIFAGICPLIGRDVIERTTGWAVWVITDSIHNEWIAWIVALGLLALGVGLPSS